jgi:hypothetical protein
MRGLRIKFTPAGAVFDFGYYVKDFDCTVQNALVNLGTDAESDPLYAGRGTYLSKDAARGKMVAGVWANHAVNFAALRTLAFSQQTETTSNEDRLRSFRLNIATLLDQTLQLDFLAISGRSEFRQTVFPVAYRAASIERAPSEVHQFDDEFMSKAAVAPAEVEADEEEDEEILVTVVKLFCDEDSQWYSVKIVRDLEGALQTEGPVYRFDYLDFQPTDAGVSPYWVIELDGVKHRYGIIVDSGYPTLWNRGTTTDPITPIDMVADDGSSRSVILVNDSGYPTLRII